MGLSSDKGELIIFLFIEFESAVIINERLEVYFRMAT